MLEEFNMTALKSTPTLRWERRETDEEELPANQQKVHRQLVGKLSWIDRADLRRERLHGVVVEQATRT